MNVSLRDYFAIQILQSIISGYNHLFDSDYDKDIYKAYEIADKMLEIRMANE